MLLVVVDSITPIRNLQVTLRGKKFEIDEATSVEEIKTEIRKLSGGKEEKADIIFNGKRLKSKDILEEAGVPDGAKLNMVPRLKKKSSTSSASTTAAAASSTSSTESTESVGEMMSDYMKKAGVDTDKLSDLMKSMGGAGGMGGGAGDGQAPDMKESMKMMSDMMSSPLFKDFLKDPERLEQSRQMMLNNPMFTSMMKSIPGMEDILNDKDAWREAMLAAVDLYQNMDISQIMEAMGDNPNGFPGMGGMGGMPGASNGLFDGLLGSTDDKNNDEAAAAAALDELSEGDD